VHACPTSSGSVHQLRADPGFVKEGVNSDGDVLPACDVLNHAGTLGPGATPPLPPRKMNTTDIST